MSEPHNHMSAGSESEAARIISRLRNFAVWNNRQSHYEPVPLCNEAAELIERITGGPTEPLQCLRCGAVDAFGPVSKERQTSTNECPSCKRMFKDGETCSRGGCPMGGDF